MFIVNIFVNEVRAHTVQFLAVEEMRATLFLCKSADIGCGFLLGSPRLSDSNLDSVSQFAARKARSCNNSFYLAGVYS